MIQRTKSMHFRLLAFLLAVLVAIGTLFSSNQLVHAADGTIDYTAGPSIPYGDYFTSRMSFDGNNTAYCVEPLKKTPPSGTYPYDLLGNDSLLRKALYYLNGGYGYDKVTKDKYFSGWSDDNSYVIGHLVVAYIYAGNTGDTGAFHGAPQSFIDKALEVFQAICDLPAPPETFRAFTVAGNGNQSLAGSWYQVPNGWIELQKSSGNPSVSDGNANYSLEGAEYGIFKNDQLIQTLVTDKNGYAKSAELEEGSYIIKETGAPKGYAVDTASYNVDVKAESTSTVKVSDIPQNNPMALILQKLDQETGADTPQGNASLANAEFTIKFYTEQSDADPAASGKKPARTWVMKTDAAGEMHFTKDYFVSGDDFYYASDKKTVCLPLGTVTIQETKAPAGYFVNETVFVQKISGSGDKETISVYNASDVDEKIYRGGVKIQKRDLETGESKPQGDATLKNATFTITNLSDHPFLVNEKLYEKDQVVLTLKTDESGVAVTAKYALPFGHYRVDETEAPNGYLNEGKLSQEFDINEHGKIVDLTAKEQAILNQVIRGDLELVKVSDSAQTRLANVPFAITSKTTGESHTIVTDKNGYASTSASWNKHTSNTNRGETSEDGIWFGASKPDDSKGALIYDTYIIEEQRGDFNKGMNLLKFEVNVYKNNVTIDLGTLTDDVVSISTTALEKKSGTHLGSTSKKLTITDEIQYEGLKKGTEYRLLGTLMDKETGEPLLIDGKPVTTKKTFTPKTSSGKVNVTFTFDASSLAGKTLVVFEELYEGEEKITQHADLDSLEQSIFFPSIGTTAMDSDTKEQISNADEEVTIIDTVSYQNLSPNMTYLLKGQLMDKETGEPILVDEKPVTSELEFTLEQPDGSVEVSFTFPADTLKGKTTVVFESLYYEERELCTHADIESVEQSIYFPEIQTTAQDQTSGTHISRPEKEVTIIDIVEYKNLIPQKEYKLSGQIMLKGTEEPLLIDGKPVTAETTFTPEEPNGTVQLTFTFDASALQGETIVCFETLTYQDKEIGFHTDIESLPQSIFFPEIHTTAQDPESGEHETPADEDVTIVDTVEYHALEPGKTYRLAGILMDKETGKPLEIDGKQVTTETTFTAEGSDGTAEVTFTFNGKTFAGKSLVVFEKLYLVDTDTKEETEITSHEDIKDEGQTVTLTELPKEEPPTSPPVKTGDDTNRIPFIILGVISAILLLSGGGYLLYKRKKNQ